MITLPLPRALPDDPQPIRSASKGGGGRHAHDGAMPSSLRARHRETSWPFAALLFWVAFCAYTAIGMILSLHYHIVDPDGPSRTANAGLVIFSRDPHLAAIGFVWNPLPSLVEIPILLFSNIWPPLLTEGQAGTFMAAAFMAGALIQVRGIANDRGLPTPVRWCLLAGFAINPMIITYAGNGMSESPFIFFSLWAVRRLLRWMRTDSVTDLIVAGIALGFDYLTRYESAAAAAFATIAVIGVTALRSGRPDRADRLKEGLLDGTVLAFPFALTFVGWTLASWITTGVGFAQFSSQYGNSSQVSAGSAGVQSFQKLAGGPIDIVVRDILHLEPLIPFVVVAVLIMAVRRVELDAVMPIAVFGGVLAFETYTQLTGTTFAWFRFFLMTIPLAVVLLIELWPVSGPLSTSKEDHGRLPGRPTMIRHSLADGLARLFAALTRTPGRATIALVAFCALVLVPSIPVTWDAMLNPLIGTEPEETGMHLLADPTQYPIQPSILTNNQYVASYLDQLRFPEGRVLVDTYIGWDVWADSTNRKQFVVTSDYDFLEDLNSPYLNGIRYILDSDPSQDGGVDAVNHRYPTIYRTGAGIATLVLTVPSTGNGGAWRVYRVNPTR